MHDTATSQRAGWEFGGDLIECADEEEGGASQGPATASSLAKPSDGRTSWWICPPSETNACRFTQVLFLKADSSDIPAAIPSWACLKPCIRPMPLQGLSGDPIVKKKVERPKGLIGKAIGRTNWNTDFLVDQPYRSRRPQQLSRAATARWPMNNCSRPWAPAGCSAPSSRCRARASAR